ncbi:hypothetical protein OU792_18290, partial [Algoriphagus sp. NF]|nr:hypothetical protein [Algoriphagus sp. NF]
MKVILQPIIWDKYFQSSTADKYFKLSNLPTSSFQLHTSSSSLPPPNFPLPTPNFTLPTSPFPLNHPPTFLNKRFLMRSSTSYMRSN